MTKKSEKLCNVAILGNKYSCNSCYSVREKLKDATNSKKIQMLTLVSDYGHENIVQNILAYQTIWFEL